MNNLRNKQERNGSHTFNRNETMSWAVKVMVATGRRCFIENSIFIAHAMLPFLLY